MFVALHHELSTRPSHALQALIETHGPPIKRSMSLHRVVHRAGSSWHDRKMAERNEEQALLAICCYPATSRGDRRVKADYLLTVEARGELDLEALHDVGLIGAG